MYNKEKNALVAECKTVSSTTDLIFKLNYYYAYLY